MRGNKLKESLKKVLERCEKTGGWFGITITSLNSKNALEDTPLHTVCSWGEIEPVKLLIDEGADVNARGDKGATPIFNAVIGGNLDVVRLLIDSGTDLSLENHLGWSIIDYAKNISAPKDIIQILNRPKNRATH